MLPFAAHSGGGGCGFRILPGFGNHERALVCLVSMSVFCNAGFDLQLVSLECDAISQYIISEKTACNGAVGEFMRHITTD
jgi:hypothetical protein